MPGTWGLTFWQNQPPRRILLEWRETGELGPVRPLIARTAGLFTSSAYIHSPTRDSESAYCQVCHQKMSQWNSTEQPSYALVERPPRDRTGFFSHD